MKTISFEFFAFVIFLLALVFILPRTLYSAHMLQIEEYNNKKFYTWILSNVKEYIQNLLLFLIFIVTMTIVFSENLLFSKVFKLVFFIIFVLLSFLAALIDYNVYKKVPQKKKFVCTKRVQRLLFMLYLLLAVTFILILKFGIYFAAFISTIIWLFIPVIILFANFLIIPIETLINNYYFNDARKRLSKLHPHVIGITGSYGKTSTKYFINHLISSKYNSFMTPESYNTAMGIAKVIRNELNESHEIFVVELAENEKGGLIRLLNLVHPEISVVTSVGIQHLEEFGHEDKIKEEIINFIKSNKSGSKVVLNYDDEFLQTITTHISDKKIITSAIETIDKNVNFYVDNISTTCNGMNFNIRNKEGLNLTCHTRILGKENVRNILLAVAVAREFGVSFDDIKRRIESLTPPPHRLDPILKGNGILVIDDSFNSNPIGAKMALEVLNCFSGHRKIIVTPGFVELGQREAIENKKLGKLIAENADFVFLVGSKQTKDIYDGLIEAKFPPEKIFVTKKLNQVIEKFSSFLIPGDIILFENDLPDTYSE